LKIVRTADSTIIIITNFYLAASSHEIFLRVGGREGMKWLGDLQRHQLPQPLAKILDPPLGRLNQWAHWARAQGRRIFFLSKGLPTGCGKINFFKLIILLLMLLHDRTNTCSAHLVNLQITVQ